MATNFPTSIDTNPGDPTPTETLAAGGHANLHSFVQDAMIAVQTYLGATASAVSTSITYLLTNVLSIDPGHKHTAVSGGTGNYTFAKGDILAARSAAIIDRLAVGGDGKVLMADSTQTDGLKYSVLMNNIQTYAPAAAGTATLDLSKGNIHHITMPAGNITIAISNGTAGQCFIIRILQDATGSRTVTWFITIKWAGGSAPTLTTTASKADTLGFEITGANTYDGFVVGQNI